VTKNAVICSLQHNQKASLRSNFMLPNVSLIDPELTISVPKDVTAATGLFFVCICLWFFKLYFIYFIIFIVFY
jgi:alcohol dehydrogenase YqhD (iron-dependent ADH family)